MSWQVSSACLSVAEIRTLPWFALPPAMEHYYRRHHSDYRRLPPLRPDCAVDAAQPALSLIYPTPGSSIYVPRELAGGRGRAVFQAAHRDADATVHWHLDDEYVTTTRGLHQVSLDPEPGEHTLTVVDQAGARVQVVFAVLAPKRS
jgi:penicillin-binding protein 1C